MRNFNNHGFFWPFGIHTVVRSMCTPIIYYCYYLSLKLSAQPYGQPNAKYVHFCTCTRYFGFWILHGLPMRCSASGMFAESNVDSCQAQIRRSIYSLRNRLDVSLNVIARSVVNSDVHITSSLHHTWIRTLYTILL